MRTLVVLLALLASVVVAQTRDGGTPAKPKAPELSAASCDKLIEHIVLISVNESLAEDAEVKKMPAKEREVTEKLARREALADPKLADLKKDCPQRFDKKDEACVLKAKTLKEIDACAQ